MKHKFSKLIVVLTATTFVIAGCNSGSNGNSNQSADANTTNSSNPTDMVTLGSSNYQTLTGNLGDSDSMATCTQVIGNADSWIQDIGYGFALVPKYFPIAGTLFGFSAALMIGSDACQTADTGPTELDGVQNTVNKIESQVSQVLDITNDIYDDLDQYIQSQLLLQLNTTITSMTDPKNSLGKFLYDYQTTTVYNQYVSSSDDKLPDVFKEASLESNCYTAYTTVHDTASKLADWRDDFRNKFLYANSSFWVAAQAANQNYSTYMEQSIAADGLPKYNYRFSTATYNLNVRQYSAMLTNEMLPTAKNLTEVELLYIYACPYYIGRHLIGQNSTVATFEDMPEVPVLPLSKTADLNQFIEARKRLRQSFDKKNNILVGIINNMFPNFTEYQAESLLTSTYSNGLLDISSFKLATANPNSNNQAINGLNQCNVANFDGVNSISANLRMSKIAVLCNVDEVNGSNLHEYTLQKFIVDIPYGVPSEKGKYANYYGLSGLAYDPKLGYPHFKTPNVGESEIVAMADTNDNQQASLDYEYANAAHISDKVNAPIANISFDQNIYMLGADNYIPTNTYVADKNYLNRDLDYLMIPNLEHTQKFGFNVQWGPYSVKQSYLHEQVGWVYQYNMASVYGNKFRIKLTAYFSPTAPSGSGQYYNDLQILLRLSCLDAAPDCVAKVNYPAQNMQQLAFADGTTVTIWPGYPTNVRSTPPTPQLINRQKYDFESSPLLASWEKKPTVNNYLYLNGELSEKFGDKYVSYKAKTLMKSAKGQYILMFEPSDQSIRIKDTTTGTSVNALGSTTGISSIRFSLGDIIAYDENNTALWSISSLYMQNKKQWITDPYAELVLDDTGKLVLYTSNILDNIGYPGTPQPVPANKTYTHIIWSSSNFNWSKINIGNPVSESAIWSLQYTPFK
jgi:hypothetical protein